MSEKTYTEREVILRERNAYRVGALNVYPGMVISELNSAAEARYPLPKITRQRIVLDPHGGYFFRLSGNNPLGVHVIACMKTGVASGDPLPTATPARVQCWADLLANPTEEVEDV